MAYSLINPGENIENVKEQKVKEIESEINVIENQFKRIIKKYNLDIEKLKRRHTENEEKMVCPYNKNHIVPKKNFEKHCHRCELIFNGINTKLSLPKPPSSQFFYTKTNTISLIRNGEDNNIDKNMSSMIQIQNDFQNQINSANKDHPEYEIKKNENDKHIICKINDNTKNSYELGEKNVNERLNEHIKDVSFCSKIEQEYLDIKNNLNEIDKIMEIVEEKKAQKEQIEKSKAQIIAEQRDYKRRRKSYRAKNVRITKRSTTEVQRDIIDSFMNDYKLFVEVENELKNKKSKHRH